MGFMHFSELNSLQPNKMGQTGWFLVHLCSQMANVCLICGLEARLILSDKKGWARLVSCACRQASVGEHWICGMGGISLFFQ